MEAILREEFIKKEISDRRREVKQSNEKIRQIMNNWFGLNIEEVFVAWKGFVKKRKKQKRRDVREKNKFERLAFEDKVAQFQIATEE
eukprot:2213551-Ditylum_brightwellii.AAC.2